MDPHYRYLFSEKEHFVCFLPVGSNLFKFITHHMVRERISSCVDSQVQTTNIKITGVTPSGYYRLSKLNHFYWKDKGEKNRTFLVSVREMVRLILKENSFQFNKKRYQYESHGTAASTKTAVFFPNSFTEYIETQSLSKTVFKPTVWKRYIVGVSKDRSDVFFAWVLLIIKSTFCKTKYVIHYSINIE